MYIENAIDPEKHEWSGIIHNIYTPDTPLGVISLDASMVVTPVPRQLIIQPGRWDFNLFLPKPKDIVAQLNPEYTLGVKFTFSVLNRSGHVVYIRAPAGCTIDPAGTLSAPIPPNNMIDILVVVTSSTPGSETVEATNQH